MPTKRDLRRYRANLQGEVDGAAVYAAMAASEKEPSVAKVFAGLGRVEEKHARFWEKRLGEAGHPPPALSPSWRARLLIWSAKHWGAEAVLPRVAAMEAAGKDLYAPQHETAGTGMTLEEHEHARVLRALLTDKQGARGSTLGLIEGRHRSVGGNALPCSARTMVSAPT
jgi:rubrerythrin